MESESEEINPSKLIEKSINTMRYAGCSPKHRSQFSIIYCYILCAVISTSCILQGVYLGTTHYVDIGSAMIDIILFDGFWQLLIKIYTVFSKHLLLSHLIDTINNKFWSHNNLETNQKNEIQSIYNITQLSIKIYTITVSLNVLGHYITAYLKGHGNLIMNIWVPQSLKHYIHIWPGHEIAFAVEAFIMGLPVLTVYIAIDTVLIITFAASFAQLKLLKYKLKLINMHSTSKENMDMLVKCAEHHAMILNFFNKMEQMFSINMLQMLGTSGLIALIALFSCLTESNVIRITEYVFMIIGVTCQLFVFCLIGQMIQDENLSIANTIYECKWEEIPDLTIRKILLLMIVRSQKNVNITMGGFAVLCLETFSKITQTMMSFLTFMLSFSE